MISITKWVKEKVGSVKNAILKKLLKKSTNGIKLIYMYE
jgi:hypothetical protein